MNWGWQPRIEFGFSKHLFTGLAHGAIVLAVSYTALLVGQYAFGDLYGYVAAVIVAFGGCFFYDKREDGAEEFYEDVEFKHWESPAKARWDSVWDRRWPIWSLAVIAWSPMPFLPFLLVPFAGVLLLVSEIKSDPGGMYSGLE